MTADTARAVLIADRDEVLRGLLKHFLNEAGLAVDFVGDGLAAFDLAVSKSPALIVTEILLPKMDGLALCRRLRLDSRTATTPVVVFSILNAGTRASEAGADAFLRKPLVESTFLTTVQGLIAAKATPKLERPWVSQ
ncbi:MAG TPA: response regulator [Longimicrobiales bacterium]|nr:response regulator [Longimicrobiales bacterium]